ncbi:hypothetical protein AYI68_g3056 [Smittium mucronatum]|uniref:RRM Nup35-type domain-containing protein n=1 Tax=Smittium mucronatum TaxID=133383 RepID=A0A1R0H101_9FUNG|nr:hypothetical protein AYI68_g3056 [Smittium mucronatum]
MNGNRRDSANAFNYNDNVNRRNNFTSFLNPNDNDSRLISSNNFYNPLNQSAEEMGPRSYSNSTLDLSRRRSREFIIPGSANTFNNTPSYNISPYYSNESSKSQYHTSTLNPNFQRRTDSDLGFNNYRQSYDNGNFQPQFSIPASSFRLGDGLQSAQGTINSNGYQYEENSRADVQIQSQESSQLPSFLLNTALGKSPTNNKLHSSFNQQKQMGSFTSRNYSQKRSITPEGVFMPISKRMNGNSELSQTPQSSFRGSISTDETPPVMTLDDDDVLLNNNKNEIFDDEDNNFQQKPKDSDRKSRFDIKWNAEDVIDQSLLIFGISRDNSDLLEQHFSKYGKIKDILGAPGAGNWAIVIYEYPESATRTLTISNENGGKLLIGDGRILVGVEKASIEAVNIAKSEQIHLLSDFSNPQTFGDPNNGIESGFKFDLSFQKNGEHSSGFQNMNTSNSKNVSNGSTGSTGSSARRPQKRVGPNPPRRSSMRPYTFDKSSDSSHDRTPNTPKFRLPFLNSPSVISSSLNTPARGIDVGKSNSSVAPYSAKTSLHTVSSNNVTPLNIKPRSGFLQTAVDLLFGW